MTYRRLNDDDTILNNDNGLETNRITEMPSEDLRHISVILSLICSGLRL
jgi:hypothetical protein